MKEVSFI